MAAAGKRTLYVCRPVLNGAEILGWARRMGFKTSLAADDLHTTIVFSREPVDWSVLPPQTNKLAVENPETPGSRVVKRLGKATVLRFEAPALEARWKAWRQAGASWDHPGYQAHVTITFEPTDDLDLSQMEPFLGPIRLGPERYKPVKENWKADAKESPLRKGLILLPASRAAGRSLAAAARPRVLIASMRTPR